MQKRDAKQFTVSEYINTINEQIVDIEAQIIGEISQATKAMSGHVYFNLKDEKNEAVLNCVMWRHTYQVIGIEFKTGMRVVVLGHGEIYARRGKFTFVVRAAEISGEGVLLKKYEELKNKLTAEGMFRPERKRHIPDYPQRIGVVTSKNGAVIHDIINNLGIYGFKIKFADARVEGPEAVMSLLDAMRSLKKESLDVLVIARGGGSLESLQAFDNELVVREIASYPVPVIAGIGHHKDVPLAALAADVCESTPTAVAPLLNKSWRDAISSMQNLNQRIISLYRNFLFRASEMLKINEYAKIFRRMMGNIQKELNDCTANCMTSIEIICVKIEDRINVLERIIRSNDPNRNLRIGYSIVHSGKKVVRSVESVSGGSDLMIRVSDGTVSAKTINTHKEL